MSLDATQWAWKVRGISASQKLVLLAMADRAGEDHACYPSARRLSVDTGLDRKTILQAITELMAAGHVADTGKRVGNGVRVLRLVGVMGREETGTKNGTGTDTETGKPTSTEIGTGTEANRYQKRDATHPENGTGTGTKNGIQNLPLNLSENLVRERAPARGTPTPVVGSFSRFTPDDWEPDPDLERLARPQPGVDREFELSQFRMHEFVNGRQDWDRAWVKWLNAARPRAVKTPDDESIRIALEWANG